MLTAKDIDISDKKDSLLAMVNPEIIESEGQDEHEEGCLSVPGVYANVERPKIITFSYTNLKGKRVTGQNDGVFARILQHEIDHLDGNRRRV